NTYLNLRYSHDCTAILEDLDNFLGSMSETGGGGRVCFPTVQQPSASPSSVGFYTDDGSAVGSTERSPNRRSVTVETQTENVQTLYIPFPKLDPPSDDERAGAVTKPTEAGGFPKPPRPKTETENTPLGDKAVSAYPS
ncbi:LOW QUALITY PROTEIN: E31B, partial [Elephant endotheliotropic herpesvirus 3B]